MNKHKTSAFDKMSNEDLSLVNKLVVVCGTLYDRINSPQKEGPHSNPAEIDSLKSQLILLSMRVGERVWYPRGNQGLSTSNYATNSERHFKNKKRRSKKAH